MKSRVSYEMESLISSGHMLKAREKTNLDSWVVYKQEYFKPQDYIEVTLSSEVNGSEFSGIILLL